MSVVDQVVSYLKGVDLSKVHAEVDRAERVTITGGTIDPIGSIEAGAVKVKISYVRKDGSAHNIIIQTKFQRHDTDNAISVDGVEMNTIVVDPDLMGLTPQLEFRYNDASEQTGAAIPDNEVTFQAGEGNHEFRILA